VNYIPRDILLPKINTGLDTANAVGEMKMLAARLELAKHTLK